MPDKPNDLVQGTPDMPVLKTLALEAMHTEFPSESIRWAGAFLGSILVRCSSRLSDYRGTGKSRANGGQPRTTGERSTML